MPNKKITLKDSFYFLIMVIGLGMAVYLIFLFFTDFMEFLTTLVTFILGGILVVITIEFLWKDVFWGQVVFPIFMLFLLEFLSSEYQLNSLNYLKYTLSALWIFYWITKLNKKYKNREDGN